MMSSLANLWAGNVSKAAELLGEIAKAMAEITAIV